MATRQPMLELPFWTDSKESQPEIVLIEGMQESKPTYRDWNYDILYPDTLTSRICIPSILPKYLAEELQPIQNRCLDIIGIPRTSLPNLEDRSKVATKRELKRTVNDINHPNQIFLTKPNTSHGCNLRSIPGSVEIPKSGTQRHTCTNLSLAKAVSLLLLWSVHFYFQYLY